MDSIDELIHLAEHQQKAFAIIYNPKAGTNELKAFISETMELLTKQYFLHKGERELLNEFTDKVSLKEIVIVL